MSASSGENVQKVSKPPIISFLFNVGFTTIGATTMFRSCAYGIAGLAFTCSGVKIYENKYIRTGWSYIATSSIVFAGSLLFTKWQFDKACINGIQIYRHYNDEFYEKKRSN